MTPDGEQLGGARSIALALAVAFDRDWPMLPWRLPGAPWLLDRIYSIVAANRHRLPGDDPWCRQHAAACDPPAR